MKKQIRKYVVCLFVLFFLMRYQNTVNAAAISGEYLENNKNSVVQVVMVYEIENGQRFILQSGSGVVLNNNTVLTNYHLVHMTAKNLEKAKKFVAKNAEGVELSGEDSLRVGIVKKDDVLIYAEIAQQSEEIDFAVLTLEEATDRMPVVFGNSDTEAMGGNVVAIGYPSIKPFSVKGTKLYADTDVNLIAGVISEVDAQSIKAGGKISGGNSGGVLLDANTGEMVGLLRYSKEDESKECFRAIPINLIKYPHLEGITYSDNSVVPAATEEVTEEATEEAQPDKTALDDTITKALGLNQSAYTSESYLILISCLQQAQQVQYNGEATQAEIDDAQKMLKQSMDNLEVIKEKNWVLIIGIIVAAILAVVAIVIMIILIVNKGKKKKEAEKFHVLPGENVPNFSRMGERKEAVGQLSATGEGTNRLNQETTLLNTAGMGSDENKATTLLNASPSVKVAYLARKKTGERIKIDSVEFTIGKDDTRVNYCVSDNEAISRCHLKLVRRGSNYSVMDLGSTNYTYLNDECLSANQEYLLKNGDSIKAADEEFILEIM